MAATDAELEFFGFCRPPGADDQVEFAKVDRRAARFAAQLSQAQSPTSLTARGAFTHFFPNTAHKHRCERH